MAAGQAHVDAFVRDKLGAAATEEGLRVVAVAQAELAQRAVERWLELLYTDSRFNLRTVDNQIRLAPPWSRSRRVNWINGIRRQIWERVSCARERSQ